MSLKLVVTICVFYLLFLRTPRSACRSRGAATICKLRIPCSHLCLLLTATAVIVRRACFIARVRLTNTSLIAGT